MAADDQPSDAVVGTEDTSGGEHSRANSRNGENSARSARTRAAADQIRQYRHKLLDLRNANKLLNFKHSDRGRTHIRVIDELPDELFGKVSEGKQLTFEALPEPEDNPKDERSERFLVALEEARVIDPAYLEAMSKVAEEDLEGTAAQKAERALKDRLRAQLGLPPRAHPKTMSVAEYARRHNFDPSYDLPEPGAKNLTRHQDSKVQTLLLPDDMQRKLSGVNDQARTNLQEKGVNTLYAAFGFLEWYESEQSERPLYAPLVLLPVEMTRGVVRERYRYSIRATGEELQTNITLAARLAQDFQSKLPNFDIESDTPESYFAKVKTAIEERKRWRVRRWITVGHFAFARLVMYQDLSPENWSGELGLAQHMVLGGLFGGTTVGDQVFAEEYEVDHPDVARKVPLLITDADSSQFSALVDAMDGKSMALQGPPGTGKSQTITNLIAAALASGRRVLFIAEKMAALEVVKNRLDAARLGDFILELHSTKAKKRDVLDAIAARLKVQGRVRAPTHLELDREVLGKLRKQLSSYVELVNRDVGRLGKTIQELFWAEARLRESVTLPTGISKITVPGALDYTPQKLTDMGDQLALLEGVEANFRNRYGGSERHPWRGVTKSDLTHFDQDEITRLTQDWLECCRVFNRLTSELEQDFGLESATLSETASLAQCLSVLPEVKGSDPRFLALMKPSDVRRSLINFVANLRVYRVVHEGLAQVGEAERSLAQPNLLRELFHICCVLMLNQHNVGEIGVLMAKAKADRDETAKLLDDCRHLIELFGLDERPTLKNLEPLLIAGRLLADLPDAALAVRSPTIIEPASKEKLLRGRNRANQIAEMVARWETHFRLPLKVEGVAERMRRHARPLLEAGYFSFLSSEVSDAKRCWRELRLAPSKAKAREMGRELYALAETTEAVQDFRADAWLSETCGALFVGHETDFEPLLAINRYAERVRAELSADPFQRKLRDLLLVGDKDKLAEVAVFVRSQAGERMTLGLRSHGGEGDDTLEEILHSRRLRHEGLATLSMSCEKLKLKDDLGLSNLDNLANQAFEGAAAKEAIEANEVARSALGSVFEGVNTHERGLEESVGLAEELATFALPESITAHLLDADVDQRRTALVRRAAAVAESLGRIRETAESAETVAILDSTAFFGYPVMDCRAEKLIRRLEEVERQPAALSEWCAYRRILEAVQDAGLSPILEAYTKERQPLEHLDQAFARALYRTMLQAAYEEHPELKRFSGLTQSQAREKFQALDRRIILQQRDALRAKLCHNTIPPGNGEGNRSTWTERALLENELTKKKRHIPLRSLLFRAGSAIQQIKPCFMMSPLSVAQYLQPDGLRFDLVVIDEASQMRPEDALGAIARGGQVVVVGDPQQLPPTSFFDRDEPPSDEEIEEEDRANNESILEVALTAFRPARRLRWHYRSRHGSLIAFSNHHFYQNDLIVFPSPVIEDRNFGVKLTLVPNGLYRGSVNLPEAQHVANEALVFMRDHPERSLGIVAMNQPQRDLILQEVELMIARDNCAQRYVETWEQKEGGVERFFVKNLETVQGDERDVIFISSTYGPNESGRVMQRFGPINGQHGYRRLNVLFTRAKERVVLFTSMGPGDVVIDEKASAGKRALRAYLEYAQHGRLDPGEESGHEPDSDFEVFVKEMLELRGYEAIPQVGVSGYWIDLGVRHRDIPGVFVLGVECDGAAYHSSKSARDRDRLRQEVLENLGWKIYRIWSTDWFADPKGETVKLAAAVDKAAEGYRERMAEV